MFEPGTVVWALYDETWWPATVQDPSQATAEAPAADVPHCFVQFIEDGSGAWMSINDLSLFSWDDDEKLSDPVAANAIAILQGMSQAAAEPEGAAETGEDAEERAAARARRKEEKKRKKAEEKAERKKEKKEKKEKDKAEKKEKRKRGRSPTDSEKGSRASSEDNLFEQMDLADSDSDRDGDRGPEVQVPFGEAWNGAIDRGTQRRGGAGGDFIPQTPADHLVTAISDLFADGRGRAHDANLAYENAFRRIDSESRVGEKIIALPKAEFIKKRLQHIQMRQRFDVLTARSRGEAAEPSKKKKSKKKNRGDDDDSNASDSDAMAEPEVVTVTLPARFKSRLRSTADDTKILENSAITFAQTPIRDAPYDARVTERQERQSTGEHLRSLREPVQVMSKWMALRDYVPQSPQDVQAVQPFGAIPRRFDAPQLALKENAEKYSHRRHVDIPHRPTDRDPNDVLPSQMDFRDFTFEQTRQAGNIPSEVPSASIEVSSQYYQGAEAEFPFDEDIKTPQYTLQSEEYSVPASAWYPEGAAASEAESTNGRTNPASRAQSVAGGRKSNAWRSSAAKIVCAELTPFFKGVQGKPKVIPSESEFKRIAHTLTQRAFERKMHREGLATSLRSWNHDAPPFSATDEHTLRKGVRDYVQRTLVKE